MDEFYSIHKVFLNRYIYQLSSQAFCVLLRFYKFYLNNRESGKSVSIPFYTFQKEILVNDNHEECESIWLELDKWDLIKRYYKQGFYELNLTEINRYNIEEFGKDNESKKERFKIFVKQRKKKIQRKKNNAHLKNYIGMITSRFSNKRIREKIQKLIDGHSEYLVKSKNKIELKDIRDLFGPLWKISDNLIEKVCDVYNNNTKYYGKKSEKYIHGILRNVLKQNDEKETKFKYENLDEFKKKKEDSDKKFALKIAKGDIKDNISYKSYLELKDFKGLEKLYNVGIKLLKEQGNEKEIFKDYEWLKDER